MTLAKISAAAVLLSVGLLASACGVKADPQPPLTPAEIGRGQPEYRSNDDGNAPLAQPTPDEQDNDQTGEE